MKKLLLVIAFLASGLLFNLNPLVRAETVNVPTEGTLSAQLTAAGIDAATVTSLSVTGNINSTDIATLKTMATSNNLAVIDLSGAIISGNVIPDNAFRGCSKLTSITIPNSVTAIGNFAFYNCTGLTAITIPDSVTTMGDYAFYNCTRLTAVNIPNSVTTIGSFAFRLCTGLTTVIIPNSVTTIGSFAFSICSGLTSVTIPNSVTTIGDYAFNNCSGLTTVNIPNSVTTIGNYAFSICSGLTSVTIPNSVTTIGSFAFYNCKCLISVDDANLNYSSEDGVIFNKDKTILILCTNSKISYTIPNSVTTIGSSAFYNCTGLTTVNIPNSVTTIGNYAFNNCTGLTTVNIPNSVTTIGDYTFGNCTRLTTISIPNSVTSVGNGAFSYCTGLTTVNIPNSVTTIGYDAFTSCTGLTTVNIPNSVTTIGDYTFGNCTGLTTVNIPNSVISIGSLVFYNCSSNLVVNEYSSNAAGITVASNAFNSPAGSKVVHVPTGSASGYTTKGWNNYFTIVADLPATGTLTVTPTVSLPCTVGSTATATITSNMLWGANVSTGADWLSVSPYSGAPSDNTLTFTAAPNTSTTARTASVTVATYDGKATQTTTVTQAGAVPPTVTTLGANSISTATATGNGNITGLGSFAPTSYGICYSSTNTVPTISDSKTDKGAATATGTFTASLTSLTPNTTYYTRAYIINATGSSYGDVVTFTTAFLGVTSVTIPSNGTFGIGQNLGFTVNFTNNIFVDQTGGTPRIAITIGSTTCYANYVSGSGTSALTFRYTVVAGNADNNGIAMGTLSANGGSLKDAGGNNTNLTLSGVGSTTGVLVDAIAPAVSITAASSSKYGSVIPVTITFTKSVTGFTADDITVTNAAKSNFTGSGTSYTFDATPTSANTVTIAIPASIAKDAAGNDNTAATSVNITVNKLKLTVNNPSLTLSKTYDGSTTAAVTAGTISNKVTGDDVTVTATASYNDATVATGKTITVVYSLSGASAPNYSIPDNYLATTGEIKTLKLTVNNPTLTLSKTYDGTSAASVTAGTISNKVTGDDVTVTATASYNDATVATGKTITVVYSLSGASAPNYSIPDNYLATTGEIKALKLTVNNPTLTLSKTYDGSTTAAVTAGTISNKVTGDNVTVTATASYNDATAATGKIITVVYSLSGSKASNYKAADNYVATTGSITPATLTIGITAIDKPYDGNTQAMVTASITQGLVTGDDVSALASNGKFSNASVGNGKPVTADISISGTDALNYTFNATATATASILDNTYPVVSFNVPQVNGSMHTSSSIDISFSEPVNMVSSALKNALVLRQENASGMEVSFTATNFTTNSVSGFTITGNFECGKSYYIAVTAGAFVDLSGNPVLLSEKTFHTDPKPDSPVLSGITSSVCPGSLISVTNYTGSLSYQWQMDGQSISGQTSDKCVIEAPGKYSVMANNSETGCQSSSDTISVTVYPVVTPVIYEKKDQNIVSLLIVDNSANTFISYEWTLADDSSLPSGMANNRQFLTVTGTSMNNQYKVRITDTNGCQALSAVTQMKAATVSSLVYPTVNSGAFKIDLTHPESGKVTIRVVNQTGILSRQYLFYKEHESATFNVDMGHTVSGHYLVEISLGNYREVKSIVIE